MTSLTRRQLSQLLGLSALSAFTPLSAIAANKQTNVAAKALPYKLAFSSWCFHMPLWRGEMKATDLPAIANQLGVDALEWTAKTFSDLKGGREQMFQAPSDKFFDDLRKVSDDAGVSTKVVNVGGPFFLAGSSESARQKALGYILQYIEPAQALGADILRTELYYDGDRKPGWEEEAMKCALDGISRMLEATRGSGLMINTENHHGISSHPEWLASLVESVDDSRFRLTVDTNNFRIDQDNPYEQDDASLPQYVDRYEGMRTLMPYASWVSGKFYAFDSTGYEISMNYPRLIETILGSGYSGYISVEYEGAGDPLEGVRQSIEMLERLGLHYAE